MSGLAEPHPQASARVSTRGGDPAFSRRESRGLRARYALQPPMYKAKARKLLQHNSTPASEPNSLLANSPFIATCTRIVRIWTRISASAEGLHFSAFHWVCVSVCLLLCISLLEYPFVLQTIPSTKRVVKAKNIGRFSPENSQLQS